MLKRKFHKIELILLVSATLIFIALVSGIIYALGFISGNVIHALSGELGSPSSVSFNLDRYNELDL
ncbi:MAG TPA: hypothetical protein VI432_02105 [Candidatus Paceibacterota bacterium]